MYTGWPQLPIILWIMDATSRTQIDIIMRIHEDLLLNISTRFFSFTHNSKKYVIILSNVSFKLSFQGGRLSCVAAFWRSRRVGLQHPNIPDSAWGVIGIPKRNLNII